MVASCQPRDGHLANPVPRTSPGVGGLSFGRETRTMGKLQVNPFAVERRLLRTKLTPVECEQSVEVAVRTSWWDSAAEISASATQEGFSLKPVSGWPFFRTAASGTFTAVPDGTSIAVRLALDLPSARRGLAFVVGVPAGVLACSLSGSTGARVGRGEALSSWMSESPLIHFGLAVLFVVGAYFISRWFTCTDGDVLMDFLREKLEAAEAEE
jgi:hypothetical protein